MARFINIRINTDIQKLQRNIECKLNPVCFLCGQIIWGKLHHLFLNNDRAPRVVRTVVGVVHNRKLAELQQLAEELVTHTTKSSEFQQFRHMYLYEFRFV